MVAVPFSFFVFYLRAHAGTPAENIIEHIRATCFDIDEKFCLRVSILKTEDHLQEKKLMALMCLRGQIKSTNAQIFNCIHPIFIYLHNHSACRSKCSNEYELYDLLRKKKDIVVSWPIM